MSDRTPTTAAALRHRDEYAPRLVRSPAEWDAFVGSLAAIEDEAEARASLDVARVARGVWTWRYGDRAWRDGGEDERGSTYIAEHIAREYAAQWWLAHQPDPFGEDRPLLDALRAALEEPTDD